MQKEAMDTVKHVAIIMDGNGRWAEMRGLPRWKGHEMGAHAVRRVTEAACRRGIAVLTLFAFSTENWKRPAKEINILFSLFRSYLRSESSSLVEHGVRLSAFGRRDRLPRAVVEDLEAAEETTMGGRRLHLRLALDYGSRHEIVEAARVLAREASRGSLRAEQIDEERFVRALMPENVPDPDLLIRTAGERRLSNFLLWQAAYSELYFCPRLWPDFEESDLESALADYHCRTRKFGALPAATGTIG
jgi:undecaprenyl diphosphate synthase